MNKKIKFEALKGTWQTQDQDSRAVIEISEKRGKPHVIASDKVDGEKFKVTKVKFENGALSFEVQVPSNKYRSRHKLQLSSKNMIKQELTFTEMWIRTNAIDS